MENQIAVDISEKSDPVCEICYKKLSEKRTINISCHIVHWTCFLKLCETDTCDDEPFACPICEQTFTIENIRNVNGNKLPDQIFRFGPIGQPSDLMLLDVLKGVESDFKITNCLTISASWLVYVCNQLEDARKSNKPSKYVQDIADERMKLLERCRILINMRDCYSTFEKIMAEGYNTAEHEELEHSEIRNFEKSLLCATCIELTKKRSRESTTTYVYNEHVSHVDEYIKQSAQYAHKSSTQIELVCRYGFEKDAEDMQRSLKVQLLTVCQVSINAYNEEFFIASYSKALDSPEDDSVDQSSKIDNEDICSICFEALARKRSINLTHCKHRFHRTCALLWFESEFIYQHEDTCPLCRTLVPKIFDEHDVQISQTYPFENEKERLLRDKEHFSDELLNLNRRLVINITRKLQRDRMLALKNGRSKEWLADIDEEIEKNRKRFVELDNFDWMSFTQREMDIVADDLARNDTAHAERDAPEAPIDDGDNTAADLPSGDNSEEDAIDDTTEASDLTVEDNIVDDVADALARNISAEAPVGVADSSDTDADITVDDHNDEAGRIETSHRSGEDVIGNE